MVFSSLRSIRQSSQLAALGLLLTATVVTGCTTGPQDITTTAESNNVTPDELSENLTSLVGDSVSVRGESQETVDDIAFILTEEELFGGEEILVINASNEPFVIPSAGESRLQVTGEVREFILVDIERDYSLTLDPEIYAEYEQQPAIVAQSIALAPEPGEITANPEQYYNQRIAVEGAVEDVLATDVFTLDEEQLFGAEDLLVVGELGTPEIQDNAYITVTGVLRPYVAAEFERDYDLTWDADLQRQIEAEYSEKPVFIAEGVYPSAVNQ